DMIKLRRIGHAVFETPDLERKLAYYTEIVGLVPAARERDRALLATKLGQLVVELRRSSAARCVKLTFEVPPDGRRTVPIVWGPLRLGPGHNMAVFHRNPDDQLIEFYCELDQMKDEALGYFDPRPWHRDRPQRPKVWEGQTARMIWGLPPAADFLKRE